MRSAIYIAAASAALAREADAKARTDHAASLAKLATQAAGDALTLYGPVVAPKAVRTAARLLAEAADLLANPEG